MFLKHDARWSSINNVSTNPRRISRRARGFFVLSVIAATTAMPLGIVHAQSAAPAAAQAGDPTVAILAAQAQPMSNDERFKRGMAEYAGGRYEEALADLQQVSPEQLIERDRRSLADTLARAERAATARKSARAEFEQGEQALAANRPTEASTHYRAAVNNQFADEGTKAKAREQLAVAETMMRQAGQSLKDMYDQAVTDVRAGNLTVAKAKFEQLQNAGYRAGLFQRSPEDYLNEINTKLAAAQPPAPVPAPAPVVTAPLVPAPAPAVTAQEPGTVPPPPAPTVAEVQPAPAPAPAIEPAPMPAPQVTETLPAPTNPRSAYRLAVQQYRAGDWIAARRNFELARDLGYKPGLFETSPTKYLAQMDAKEQRDAVVVARVGAQAQTTLDVAVRRSESQQLVDQAETARAAGRLDEALALYIRAAELDQSNAAAAQGRDQLAAQLSRQGGQIDLLTAQQIQNQQQRDYVSYTFTTAIADANRNIAASDFRAAQDSLERARVARNLNTGVFRDEELRGFDTTIAQTQNAIAAGTEALRLNNERQAGIDAGARVAADEAARRKQIESTVADLVREARRQTEEGQYQQAINTLDQILRLDPKNDYALGARPLVEDRALVLQQRYSRERLGREFTRHLNAAEEMKIPYFDILKYPDNWPDLSATRDQTILKERGQRAEDQEVIAKLERRLPEIKFDAVAFNDVVEFLRDVSSANIFVNWRALETSGVDRTTPVTARLQDVKFSKALDLVLRDVGGAGVKLGYTVDEGVITISTDQDLSSNVVTNVYDIRDLIVNVQDFTNPPTFNIQSTPTGRGGGGGGGNLFGGGLGQQNNTNQNTRQQLVDEIRVLIQDTVATESWKDNGGTVGSLRELAGQLIVTQTPENQRQLSHLLEQLRETRAIQITVETRFLTVQRNFLEEIGVDFDFLFPSGQIWGSQVTPIAIQNNTSTFTDIGKLITSVPGNIATDLSAGSSGTGGVTPNLGINNGQGGSITFLDDFQVNILIRATQNSQTTTTLTAPRLTLFNGQFAFVAVSTDTAYVSDLTPVVASNAVAFDPTVSTIGSGVLLYVQATVSSDRKYVTLTLQPTLTRVRQFLTFPVNAVVNIPATGTGGAGSTQIATGNIQQPIQDTTTVATTVSVPDGGTLLMGGQTLAGEIEREAGVPILSKIPFLKRLFTNTAMAKDEQILLILVKPTIIIQREKEQEQFPLMGTRS